MGRRGSRDPTVIILFVRHVAISRFALCRVSALAFLPGVRTSGRPELVAVVVPSELARMVERPGLASLVVAHLRALRYRVCGILHSHRNGRYRFFSASSILAVAHYLT